VLQLVANACLSRNREGRGVDSPAVPNTPPPDTRVGLRRRAVRQRRQHDVPRGYSRNENVIRVVPSLRMRPDIVNKKREGRAPPPPEDTPRGLT
jgi:hypothetical protein